MKKCLYGSLLMLTLLLSASCRTTLISPQSDARTVVARHGQLRVSGTALVDARSDTVTVHGVSLGWHNWWPRFYNAQTIRWLKKDWNIEVVRAAIGVEPDQGYLQNPETALKSLYAVVDAAIAAGVYVIVDWHAHQLHPQQAKEFFRLVAQKYGTYPNVIYEIFNEPVNTTWVEIQAYAQEVIPAIRAIDPDNIILVGCPNWDQDIHLVADKPLEGFSNLMYTVHFYAGTHKQFLRERTEYALGKGIPIFVSECAGMNADGDGSIDWTEWETWKKWMARHKLSWIAWSIADKNESCSMITDQQAPASGWSQSQLKPWGKMVRQDLKTINK